MQKIALQVLFGLCLCTIFAGCMIYSSLGLPWEAQNLDGSISITWRSGVVLLLLIGVVQWISLLTFRRRIALQVFLGLVLFVAIATLILSSSFSFSWEPQGPEGTFSLTWRSDVVILLFLSVTQGLSFTAFHLIRLRSQRRHSLTTSTPPNV